MGSREGKACTLWPAYFDARRSREEGRRVPRRSAVENPSVEEIAAAAKSLGFQASVEKDKGYPATPWRRDGRVIVEASSTPKTEVLRKIAHALRSQRS